MAEMSCSQLLLIDSATCMLIKINSPEMTESHTYAAVFKVNLCDGSRVVGQLLVRVIHYLCYMVESLLEPVTPTDTPTENYTVTRMYTDTPTTMHTYVHTNTMAL